MQECSCPNKAVLCRELCQADISDPVPTLGLPAGTAGVKGHPSLLLCWPGPHSSPEGQQPVEGAGLAAALPSREAVQLSHHGTLGSRRSKGNILQ